MASLVITFVTVVTPFIAPLSIKKGCTGLNLVVRVAEVAGSYSSTTSHVSVDVNTMRLSVEDVAIQGIFLLV